MHHSSLPDYPKESLFFKRDKVALGLRGFPFTDALLFFVNSFHYILHIIILRALSIQVFGLFLSIGYFLFLKNKRKPPVSPQLYPVMIQLLHFGVFSGLVQALLLNTLRPGLPQGHSFVQA